MRKAVRITQSDGEKRYIGFIDDGAFVAYRNESKHMYRGGLDTLREAKKQGTASWGLDAITCDKLIELGIEVFHVISDKKKYVAKLKDLKEHEDAFVVHHKPHRAQYFLPIQHFFSEPRTPIDNGLVTVYKFYAEGLR